MRHDLFRKVLIAIDVYADYHKILAHGIAIAGGPEHVSLVQVILPEVYFSPYAETVPSAWLSEARAAASAKLNEVASAHHIATERAFLTGGPPAEEIAALADDLKVDLIVIGTHGQRGFRLLLGSTANALLHGIDRDVLVVRV